MARVELNPALAILRGELGNLIFKMRTIRVRASDDFEVAGVTVSISGSEAQPIEHGVAVLSSMKRGRWVYTTTTSVAAGTQVRVEATATDKPGNTATKAEDIVV